MKPKLRTKRHGEVRLLRAEECDHSRLHLPRRQKPPVLEGISGDKCLPTFLFLAVKHKSSMRRRMGLKPVGLCIELLCLTVKIKMWGQICHHRQTRGPRASGRPCRRTWPQRFFWGQLFPRKDYLSFLVSSPW